MTSSGAAGVPTSVPNVPRRARRAAAVVLLSGAALLSGAGNALLGNCGPFTDVAADGFCSFVLEIFYLGITTGTSPTTYDPTSNVSRLQMAAFLSRTVDGVLKRGGRRASLDQFWTTQSAAVLGLTTLPGTGPGQVQSDGADLWVAQIGSASASRVRASDGKVLETWTGMPGAVGVKIAMGRVFVAAAGHLYLIDPTQAAGAGTDVANPLGTGNFSVGIAFDGARLWTANKLGASVSIVTPAASIPWTVTTVTTGFSAPWGALYDGANVWITDATAGTLMKLDATGSILNTITLGPTPGFPVFDGSNIWAPASGSVTVVRVSSGAVLATLTGNGIGATGNSAAAFDGQRVLVVEQGLNVASLWKAADLTPISNFSLGPVSPFHAASDGVNFWIDLSGTNQLARF